MNGDYITKRCLEEAYYIIQTRCTIREAAKNFNVPKSTVHYDIVNNLKNVNKVLYHKVREINEWNAAQRSKRGGEALREKRLQKAL